MNNVRSLQISLEANYQLSEEQKLFNKFIEQIDKKKKELTKWEQCITDHKLKIMEHQFPLEQEIYLLRKQVTLLLDSRFQDTNFTNGEKRKLKCCISDLCMSLLEEKYDKEIERIYKKYCNHQKQTKSVLDVFVEDLKARIEEDVNKFSDEYMQDDHAETDEDNLYEKPEESKSEKLGRESIKEIYKKLAMSLHPDKEIDEEEKKRKTKVIQRVNQAYKEKNLTELLTIELEETKLTTNAAALSKGKVKGLNEVLKKELDQLKYKIYLNKRYFQVTFPGIRMSGLSQKKINALFDQELSYLNQTITVLKKDLKSFSEKSKNIKAFLKSIEIKRNLITFNV